MSTLKLPIWPRIWATVGALNGFFAVALAAMGTHALDTHPHLETFLKGTRYEMWHAFALLATAWVSTRSTGVWAPLAGSAFTLGILFFCGTLYLLTLLGEQAPTLGAPVGGILLLIGWLSLAIAAWRMPPPSA